MMTKMANFVNKRILRADDDDDDDDGDDAEDGDDDDVDDEEDEDEVDPKLMFCPCEFHSTKCCKEATPGPPLPRLRLPRFMLFPASLPKD